MAKTWLVEATGGCGSSYKSFNSYDAAETAAKRRASSNQTDVNIFESIATAKAVVPVIEVVKIEA